MKKTILSAFILSAIAMSTISFSSCKKDSKTAPSPAKPSTPILAKGQSAVSATFSGTFARDYKSALSLSSAASSTASILIGSAYSTGAAGETPEQFNIILPGNISSGAHNTGDAAIAGVLFQYIKPDGTGWSSKKIERAINFNITKIYAEEIEGTFEGKMGSEEDASIVNVKGTFAAKL